jgi:hypothetical protein
MTASPNEQLDLLISRIADGEASRQDWTAFADLAANAPEAWKSLAQAQRDHQSLSLAVGVALHAAERVDLPTRHAADAFLRRPHPESPASWSRARQFGGWAVAAMIALAWLGVNGGQFTLNPGKPTDSNTAGIISVPKDYFHITSPDDALQLYRDQSKPSGRVLAEVPVLLESRPNATGRGYEVVYVRQILERAQVENLLRFAQDERGRPIPVRVTVPGRADQAE